MTKQIPNLLTCLNLVCGCVAIVFIFNGKIDLAGYCVAGSLIFDFLDGFVARVLKAGSSIGKELDSLADMISFGLVPGMLGCHLCLASPPLSLEPNHIPYQLIGYFPLLITVAAAIRLARFNADNRQAESFIGVPTPAITILMLGVTLIVAHDQFNLTPRILNPFFICGLSMVVAWLMNSEMPMIALKFKSFSISENRYQYLLILLSLCSVMLLGHAGIAICIVWYILISAIHSPKIQNIT